MGMIGLACINYYVKEQYRWRHQQDPLYSDLFLPQFRSTHAKILISTMMAIQNFQGKINNFNCHVKN